MFHLYLDNFNFEPAFCADEDKCELTFTLTDNYNDSWNGNAIRVVDEESNTVLADMTNVGNNNTETHTLAACDGRQLRFEWVTGEWPEECSYTVTDINGNVVFTGSNAMSEPVSFTPDCTPIFNFDGYWNDGDNWNIGVVPQAGKDVIIQADAVIPAGYTANAWDVTIESGSILIKDGGQLKHSNEVQGNIQKFIQGFGSNDSQGGWYLLKGPIIRPFTLDKAIESGMVGGTLDDPDVTLNFITDEQHPFVGTATDTYVVATLSCWPPMKTEGMSSSPARASSWWLVPTTLRLTYPSQECQLPLRRLSPPPHQRRQCEDPKDGH